MSHLFIFYYINEKGQNEVKCRQEVSLLFSFFFFPNKVDFSINQSAAIDID